MKTAIRFSFVFVPLLALFSACGGETQSSPRIAPSKVAQIDEYIQGQMAKQHIPGLSIAVVQDGKLIMEKGYGLASIETQAAVTPETVFRIGSVTKQFTASAVMLLVQEGKISLDDSIRKYLPSAPDSWQAITIRHLLNHTSGLRRDFTEADFLALYDPQKDYSMDELVTLLGQLPMEAEPGESWIYSNFGYHLLGFLVEKVSGQHYATFLNSRIFEPLGMKTADVIRTDKRVPSMASGYAWADGALHAADDEVDLIPGNVEGEGGLQMSAQDLAKWDAALHREQILTPSSLQQMWTPGLLNDSTPTSYGFGWGLNLINDSPFVLHGGNITGFTSRFDRHPQEGLSVIVLNNLDQSTAENISARIASIINPALTWKTIPDVDPVATTLAQNLVNEMIAGTFNADRFTPEEQARSATGYAVYVKSFHAFGAIESFGLIDHQLVDGFRTYRYLVTSHAETVVLILQLDADNKVRLLHVAS